MYNKQQREKFEVQFSVVYFHSVLSFPYLSYREPVAMRWSSPINRIYSIKEAQKLKRSIKSTQNDTEILANILLKKIAYHNLIPLQAMGIAILREKSIVDAKYLETYFENG